MHDAWCRASVKAVACRGADRKGVMVVPVTPLIGPFRVQPKRVHHKASASGEAEPGGFHRVGWVLLKRERDADGRAFRSVD